MLATPALTSNTTPSPSDWAFNGLLPPAPAQIFRPAAAFCGIEAGRRGETRIVDVERIGHDEQRLAADGQPIGKIVVVGIGVVDEATLLDNETAGLRAYAALVPSERSLAGQALDRADR